MNLDLDALLELPTQAYERGAWLYEDVIVTGLNEPGEELEPVELYQSVLRGATLTGAQLRRWVFEGCLLVGCELSNVSFEQCSFEGCHFIDCKLVGSDWRACGSLKLSLSFKGCDLSYSLMSGLSLPELSFEDCRCHELSFAQSDLRGARWLNSSVLGAQFEDAKLDGAELSGALDERFDPSECSMRGATVSVATAIRLAEAQGLKVSADP